MQKVQFSKDVRRKMLSGVLFFLISTCAFAQRVVTGMVTDKTGLPLIGVNVVEKGTTNGNITGEDGKYSLTIENGKVIVFSYIGFLSQEITADKSVINVVLEEDSKALEEVVVIGYGSMTRKDVTSSITTVNADNLNVGVYSNPAQLLQGKVPGLTITQSSDPNSTPSMTLRGASTIRTGAAQEPYYVIDGVPGISLSTISPDDIESIDVLRDASATAIYGSKAANGVIIVTTKKGKAGKTSVNYSAYVALDKVAKNWDVMNASEYRAYANASGKSLDPLDYFDETTDTDWQKEVQRLGVSHNHNISISGGSDKTTYNASVNYMKNEGVIKKTSLERLIGRAFVETKTLKDRLTLSLNVNASVTNQDNVPADVQGMSVYDAMTYYLPISPIKTAEGEWFENATKSQYYNPVSLIEENTYEAISKRLQGNAKASLKIIDGLTYNLSLAYQNEHYTYNTYNSTKSLINAAYKGYARRASVENKKKMLETYINFDRTFNDVHKLGIMAGYSWEEGNDNDGFQLSTYNYFNDALGYHNLGMGNEVDLNGFGDYRLSTLRMISFYGRANYSFNSKYLLQATVRRDGSSAFGKNNRWATFPSFSVAWRLAEEDFIKNLNVFDDLKLRVGYGVSGNSLGFDAFTAIQRYKAEGWFNSSSGKDTHMLIGASNANPDLKWERTGMFNVGIDFGFFNNRLSGTIEYYNKLTKDLIADYEVSTTKYLYKYMQANVGEVSNKGIEITLNAIPVQTKNFTWQTTLNLSHNKNKVEKLHNDEYAVTYMDKAKIDAQGQSNNYQQRIMEGYPIGQFYTWEWAGWNEDGVSLFYVHDPKTGERTGETTTTPTDADRTFTGSAQPKLNLGWNNSLTWKGWTLTAFFQGVFGNDILNASRAYLHNASYIGLKNIAADFPTTDKANDTNSQMLSDRYIENGSYLRLSTLSLGYDFGNIGDYINGLRVYATCNNVFCISGYKGLDPEVSLGGIEPGIDNRQTYPRTRTFMLGVNINF